MTPFACLFRIHRHYEQKASFCAKGSFPSVASLFKHSVARVSRPPLRGITWSWHTRLVRHLSLTYDRCRSSVPDMAKSTKAGHNFTSPPRRRSWPSCRRLWDHGPSTVREIHTALRSRQTRYTTTLKQMQLMTDKGLLDRSERFRSHVYEARIRRDQTQLLLTKSLLSRAFQGSTKNLVLGALSSQPVSRSELAEIREILDRFEKEKA